MRILNAGQNYFVAGGSDSYQLALERLLTAAGHDVVPFAAQSPKNIATRWAEWFPVAADFAQPGVLDAMRYIYNPQAASRLDALLAAHPVDIAHLHIYYGKLTGSILPVLRRKKIPVVQTLHEYKLVCPVYTMQRDGRPCHECAGASFHHALQHRCNRASFARSALTVAESCMSLALGAQSAIDAFIAPSEFVRQAVVSMGIAPERIRTIHNFVEDAAFSPAVLRTIDAVRTTDVVFVGRIERNKGVFTLLDVAARLPELTFHLAGHGSASAEVAAAIRNRGLANVRLPGFIDAVQVVQLLGSAGVAVVPSEWDEPFGLSVVEAMAAGTPVVASRVGGIPEIITHGHDGYLCPPGDAQAFAESIRRIVGSPDLAARLGATARKTVQSRFSQSTHLHAVEQLYDDVRRLHAARPGGSP